MKLGKFNKKLMAMVLAAAEVMTVFQLGAINVNAEASMTQEECREIVSTYSVNDSVPSYSDYLAEHADAVIPDISYIFEVLE